MAMEWYSARSSPPRYSFVATLKLESSEASLVADEDESVRRDPPPTPFRRRPARAHIERQDAERPVVPLADSLVFMTDDGLAVDGSWFTKHFLQLHRRAGLPVMRLHDLGDGAASLRLRGKKAETRESAGQDLPLSGKRIRIGDPWPRTSTHRPPSGTFGPTGLSGIR